MAASSYHYDKCDPCSHIPEALMKIDCKIKELLDCCKIPGIAIGIQYDHKLIYRKVFGQRNCGAEPIEFNSQFQWGSVSTVALSLWAANIAEEGSICPGTALYTLGNAQFLGPSLTFVATIADILSFAVADEIFEEYEGAFNAWKSSHNGHDTTNLAEDPYTSAALVRVENYELIQETAELMADYLDVDLQTNLQDYLNNDLGLSSVVYNQANYLAAPNPALNQLRCDLDPDQDNDGQLDEDFLAERLCRQEKYGKKCNCGPKECCYVCKYTFNGDDWFAALGASGNIDDFISLMQIYLNCGILQGEEKICTDAMREFVSPIIRGINQPECGEWFYSLSLKTRYYQHRQFYYAQGFMETGSRSLIMVEPECGFGIAILVDTLSPAPEALAIMAYYLIALNECKQAFAEFDKSWCQVTNYIRKLTDEHIVENPPSGLATLVIDPTGTWSNPHFGDLVVSKNNGNYLFTYKEATPAIGVNLGGNFWRFYYQDKHNYPRVFQVNFTMNAQFRPVLAQAFTNETLFTMDRVIENPCQPCGYLCGEFAHKKECILANCSRNLSGCPTPINGACNYNKCGNCYRPWENNCGYANTYDASCTSCKPNQKCGKCSGKYRTSQQNSGNINTVTAVANNFVSNLRGRGSNGGIGRGNSRGIGRGNGRGSNSRGIGRSNNRGNNGGNFSTVGIGNNISTATGRGGNITTVRGRGGNSFAALNNGVGSSNQNNMARASRSALCSSCYRAPCNCRKGANKFH